MRPQAANLPHSGRHHRWRVDSTGSGGALDGSAPQQRAHHQVSESVTHLGGVHYLVTYVTLAVVSMHRKDQAVEGSRKK